MKRYSLSIGLLCLYQEEEDTFEGTFDSVEEAKIRLAQLLKERQGVHWFKIYDTEKCSVVYKN